jgi:hypothetical protein
MFFKFSQGLVVLCIAILLSINNAVAAGDSDFENLRSPLGREWVLTKNDRLRNIKTYVRLEDGKQFRSFKVEAVFEASMQTISNVLLDFNNYTKWYWETRESRLLQQKSSTDFIVYIVHKAPQGLPDRDVILHGVIEPQTSTKRSLVLKVVALPDYLPAKPPLVRMPAEDISIKFSPLPNGKIQAEAEGYFDAGGAAPVWATNFVQRIAPYSVVRNLQRMLLRDEYRNSKQPPLFPMYDYEDYMPANNIQP